MSQQDLGLFIRKHRERLSPRDAGLRSVGRRRTPGLRREELAQLCEVSATWITWLEQGRPVQASTTTLLRLAAVLQLSDAERRYLFSLAGKVDPSEGPEEGDAETALRAVHHLDCPAYVLDRLWNVQAWNAPARVLFGGWLDGAAPNLLRFTFLEPAARRLIADWPDRARRLVAEFRADCGRHLDEVVVQDMVDELCEASADFARYWQDQEVLPRDGGLRRFHLPDGTQDLLQTTFQAALRLDLKLVLLMPSGLTV